jgi:hypothetical protein
LAHVVQPPFHLRVMADDLRREHRRPPIGGPPLLLPLPHQHRGTRRRRALAVAGGRPLQQPDEVKAILVRHIRDPIPVVGGQPQPVPTVPPAEEQDRVH